MKRIRMLIGVFLILGAIGGLIYWEVSGREVVLMDQLLVANETILPGTHITPDLFAIAGVMEENRIEGALEPETLSDLIGLTAKQRISKNSQVAIDYFVKGDLYIHANESIFVIQPEWIAMRSSSLRRGDWIDIYGDNGQALLGTYRVAFVKDENEIEVTNQGNMGQNSALDRTDSSSVISHVEIIGSLAGYQEILEKVGESTNKGLLLVQRGEK